MSHKVTKTSTCLSKTEELLGVTDELKVAPGYTIFLSNLAPLNGQVPKMNKMFVTSLEKDKGPPRSDSNVEDSPYVRNLKNELEALREKIKSRPEVNPVRFNILNPKPFDDSRDGKALENFM